MLLVLRQFWQVLKELFLDALASLVVIMSYGRMVRHNFRFLDYQVDQVIRWSGDQVNQVIRGSGESGDQVNQVNQVIRWIRWSGESGDQVNQVIRWISWSGESGDQVIRWIRWSCESGESGDQVNQVIRFSDFQTFRLSSASMSFANLLKLVWDSYVGGISNFNIYIQLITAEHLWCELWRHVQYSAVQCSAVQCSAVQCSAVQ
jgi:hypothetical protein